MSRDSTYVNLRVLNTQADDAVELFDYGYSMRSPLTPHITEFGFEQVNYGELGFLDQLRDAGIAYDSYWFAGQEYTSGTQSCRFTPEGECIELKTYDEQINPALDVLMGLLGDYEALKAHIISHHAQVTPLPFDEAQVTNGQRYRARKLIEIPAKPDWV